MAAGYNPETGKAKKGNHQGKLKSENSRFQGRLMCSNVLSKNKFHLDLLLLDI